ncbi:uncharacterized protein PG986_007600 [Apiospora aurea]|uniref:Uncharacterized protein n=1 Tax=Apiospora aurea TaxID=335848 RepID=A0ABR1QDB8_9PEZI
MPNSMDDVCPPYGAEDAGGAGARPNEQLHFTRHERIAINTRLLAGVAALQALAMSLLIAINVGGSMGSNGSVLAEDTFILTWTGWYIAESSDKTMNLLYTFYFYFNSLCVRHINGASCLYHKVGHSFDDVLIDKALRNHFNETYQADLDDGAFKFASWAGMKRKGITLGPFVLILLGMVIGLSSWLLVLVNERAKRAGLRRVARIGSVVTQMVSGVVLLVAGVMLRADSENAYNVLKKATVKDEGTGWGFFAAVFCAALAQILAGVIQWTWAAMRPSLDKIDQGNEAVGMLPANDDQLPAYSRYDPMGQPPSLDPGYSGDSFELQDMSRPHSRDSDSPEAATINRGN